MEFYWIGQVKKKVGVAEEKKGVKNKERGGILYAETWPLSMAEAFVSLQLAFKTLSFPSALSLSFACIRLKGTTLGQSPSAIQTPLLLR